jgi:hypothetical protein
VPSGSSANDPRPQGARPGDARRPGPLVSPPEVLLIGYAADTDLAAVSARLSAAGIANLLWLYEARADELTVDATPGSFRLARGDEVLSSDDFAGARVVVHRTGLGHWRSPVSAPSAAAAERAFTEREWASLLHGLLLEAEQRHPHLTWLNPPSISAVTSGKYALLASADLDGLTVPDLRVSTDGQLPSRSASGEYVCKAISEDEGVDDTRTYCTAVLDAETLAALPFRSDCPSLIQERVLPRYELRVYYLLGETLGVRIRADRRDYADLRLVPLSEWSAEVATISPPMHAALRAYCGRRHLSYCVFDFLRAGGCDLLIDVTPSGTWSHLESPSDPVITTWYADILARVVREASPSRLTYIRIG